MTAPRRSAAYLRASTLLLILSGCTLCLGGAAGWYLWRARHSVQPPAIPGLEGGSGLAKAVAEARTAIENSPTSAAPWGNMGMLVMAHGLYPQAEACFQQAIQLDPKDNRWVYFHGLILLRTDPAGGIHELERAVELSGAEPALRLKLAEVLLGEGRLDEAERNFQVVLADEPVNPRAEQGLGQLARARGKWEESLQHLQRSAEHAPGMHSTHVLLAEIYKRLGNDVAARSELDLSAKLSDKTGWHDRYLDAVSRLKTDVQSRTERANALFKSGQSREALKLAHETVQSFPESDVAHIDYGVLLLNTNALAAAEHELREAVRLQPESLAAQSALGLTLLRQGRYQEALQSLRTAVRLNPQYAIAYYNLGVCYQRLGDTGEAVQAFRNAVKCKPDFSIAHRELANALADKGQLPEALAHLQDAVRLAPGDDLAKARLESVQQQVNRNAKK